MGIVIKQSFRNTIIIYLSFLVGGINTIIFYPRFLESEYYGIVTFILSASNLIMPLTAFGIQYTIVKFFSFYQDKVQKDRFLTLALVLPFVIALPIGYLWDTFHHWIMSRVAEENQNVESYTFYIYTVAVSCAFFEIFYAWTKVHLQTVFGNVLKEFWNRAVVMLLLVAVFFNQISKPEFIQFLAIAYVLRTLVMMVYAFNIYLPKFSLKPPDNFVEIIRYSLYIILAGSAGAILLDIDKVMIPGREGFQTAAYYTVAVFIGTFIEAPSRAMNQILQPLTSKTLNEKNDKEVGVLYKKSSINLLVIGGLFFLLVNCGVHELFKLMPEKGYSGGELVVLMISLAKLYTMFLGNNGAIISNSKFYRITLPIGVGMAIMVYLLNRWLFGVYGTNGLALATLITIFSFNTFKLFYVKAKFSILPFTDKTWRLMTIIAIFFFGFYFWNFNFNFGNEIVNILSNLIVKCGIIFLAYVFLIIRLKISDEISTIFRRFTGNNQ
ncbi:MAG: sugar isomerase [Flavobacteriaceae bacterium]|nr:sugar isomerase [Flavobacteriaceae bacterium]|tara:strand:- start:30725 stop:32209 length:1485 start_codon:yes stop_codon:yes gene_type:complete